MRLLVSVSSATEALAAREGGADVIDAKDPAAGALGAVSLDRLREICSAVGKGRLLTAALGDATDETIEAKARLFASAGAALLKVGFAGIADRSRARALLAAALRGADAAKAGAGVVAVAYADAARCASVPFETVLDLASQVHAQGVLVDTADKNGPGLRALVDSGTLAAWIVRAHDAALFVAVAGRLTAEDLPWVRDAGADIAGVRGAACEGGRTGRVSAARVVLLRTLSGEGSTTSGAQPQAVAFPSGTPLSAASSRSGSSAATTYGVTSGGRVWRK
jgi:uncharacterized protein (UPF0264 family)